MAVSTTNCYGGLKRKFSDSDSDSSSTASSNSPTQAGSLPDTLSSDSQKEIKPCTNEWTQETLRRLSVRPILSELYSPAELINMAFSEIYLKLLDPKIDERVFKCKECILTHSPLNKLDICDIEHVDESSSYSLMFEFGDGIKYMKISEWDVAPTGDVMDKVEKRLYKKFHVHGESFTERLIDIFINQRSKDKNISEHRYQSLFQSFVGALGLSTFGDPDIIGKENLIGDVHVKSAPDIIFPCFGNSDESMKILAVCKVKKYFNGYDELSSSMTTTTTKRRRVQAINHLDDNLIGQHGGELLLHLMMSQNLQGLLGFIIQKTWVTFTFLRCTKKQYDKTVTGAANIKGSCPEIYYSRPYNYLTVEDRNEILGPLLKLGFIQSAPISNH